MQVAITGGTGFIGRSLVQAHLLRGDSVRILSRKSHPEVRGVEYIVGDLLDKEFDSSPFLKEIDVLYHCAGQLSDESKMRELHIDGTRRLLKHAKGNVKRWVQLSSVGVYKKKREGRVDEETEIAPEGIYEETKALADQCLITYAEENNLGYSILRPSNVFGATMTNQSLASLVQLIKKKMFFYIGKGGATVNYVPVGDVVSGLIACATQPEALGQIFNLSQTTGVKEMINALAQGAGVPQPKWHLPERPVRIVTQLLEKLPGFPLTIDRINALTSQVYFNSDKIKAELGFSFKQALPDALKDYGSSR